MMKQLKPDEAEFKIKVLTWGVVSLIVVILAWSLPLSTIHSDTFFIGGRWFATLVWIVRGIGVVGVIAAVAVALDKGSASIIKFLKGRQQVINAKLKNDKLRQELTLTPSIISTGLERGFSVEYDKLKVYNPIERVHESFRYDQPKQEMMGESPPEPFNFIDALSDYELSEKGIILGKSNKGLVTVPLGDKMCHVALASKTGGGKSNAQRVIATQLLALNQVVYFLDPTWQDIRVNNEGQKFDYRPIRNKLAEPPATTPEAATDVMRRLVEETKKRMRVAEHRATRFQRKYIIADELPHFAQYSKDFINYLTMIVRIGRNYGIYLIVAAQDFQNNTLNVEGGAFRSNFLTNFFGNGDLTTARLLLRLERAEKPDLYQVGSNGVFLLNAQGYSNSRTKVRIPLGDNESVYQLLGGRPDVSVDDEPVQEYTSDYEMEPLLPSIVTSDPSPMSDIDRVKAAWNEIEKPSRRKVAARTGFSDTKSGDLINELKRMNEIV
jgi:hypothetical protein